MPTDQDLRRALINFRESTILGAPGSSSDRKHGILRRAMIDHLVAWKPVTRQEWLEGLPRRLAVETDRDEFHQFAADITAIVRRHVQFNGGLRAIDRKAA